MVQSGREAEAIVGVVATAERDAPVAVPILSPVPRAVVDQPAALQVAGLAKRYAGVSAVDGVSLRVEHGEVFGFLGPNGAGKTTTIGMILGLLAPTAGRISLFGKELGGREAELLPRVGALVEMPTFYPFLGARDNLRAVAVASPGVTRARVEETLRLVRLAAVADRPYRTYSLGMKQRLGIGAALLADPDLVILDEPTNGLDPAGIVEIRSLLRELAIDGKAVFLSSHQLNEVQQICDRVAIVHGGRIVAAGPVPDLLRSQRATRLTVSDPDRGLDVVRSLPWVRHAEPRAGTINVWGDAPDPYALSATLARAGVYLGQLTRVEGTLEHVFLGLTGDWHGPVPSGNGIGGDPNHGR